MELASILRKREWSTTSLRIAAESTERNGCGLFLLFHSHVHYQDSN